MPKIADIKGKKVSEVSKVAVISGGTGYVGSAIARKLSVTGMTIALLYHNASKEKVHEILSGLSGSGHKAYQCPLESEEEVNKAIGKIEVDLGNIFACVHAAGGMPLRKQFHMCSESDIKGQFAANVFGSSNFLNACALRMKEHRAGVIIGITTAGVIAQSNTKARGVYSAVKFAIQGMLVALKEELASSGIRVYSVAPGVMSGGMNADTPKAFLDMAREKSPTKTLADADDVAAMTAFLSSDDAAHIANLTLLVAPESALP